MEKEKSSTDIDCVWLSLKAIGAGGGKKLDALNLAAHKKKKKETKATRLGAKDEVSERKCVASLKIETANSSDQSVSGETKAKSETQTGESSRGVESNNSSPPILALLNENGSNSTCTQCDSDDEDEQDNLIGGVNIEQSSDQGRPWTMNRFVSTMQSQSVSERAEALTLLKSTIESLCKALPTLPILNFPPPYDVTRIVLTHRQGSAISDMPNGEFAPQWEAWQRTYSSLGEQFAPGSDDALNLSNETSVGSLPSISKQMQALMDSCGIAFFRRFNYTSEKCRELALRCASLACLHTVDIRKHLPFLMSAIMSLYLESSFDSDMSIFIHDVDSHESYKRGVAEERQDRAMLYSRTSTFEAIEKSEENRLILCTVLSSIVRGHYAHGTMSVLNPYFSDFIFALQRNLLDPFPAVKIESSLLLVQLLRIPQWEAGATVFATALARASLMNMRNRNSKVRHAAIELFEASVSVPDRDKVKGAGTEAISDLVGFREENVSCASLICFM